MRMFAPLLLLALVTEPAAPVDEVPSVRLQLDLGALPDDDVTRGLEHFVRERQTEVIQDAGLTVRDDAPMEIRIRVSRYGDGDVHSRAELTLVDAGDGGAPREQRTVECELCSDGELVEEIGQEVGQLSTQVLHSNPEDEVEEEPSKVVVEPLQQPLRPPRPVVQDEVEPPVVEDRRLVGPLGFAGITALVAGAAGLATGIPLIVRRVELRVVGDGLEVRRTQPVGLLLTSIGGTLLATGSVLVAVDNVMLRKRRRIYVRSGPTGLGFTLAGRF